jgi:hypothetical protein
MADGWPRATMRFTAVGAADNNAGGVAQRGRHDQWRVGGTQHR